MNNKELAAVLRKFASHRTFVALGITWEEAMIKAADTLDDMYGDAPDVDKMVEAAAKAARPEWFGACMVANYPGHETAYQERAISEARAALESLGIPLPVLAAIRAGEWVAVPKELTASMYRAHSESYEYVPPGAERAWRVLLSAAPKTPEEAR